MTRNKKDSRPVVLPQEQPSREQTIASDPEVIVLSARDSLIFAEALLNPPEPSEQLLEAARRHKELIAK